jgi:threonine dehydrogenase-like Zn-dependent dehydrogenase
VLNGGEGDSASKALVALAAVAMMKSAYASMYIVMDPLDYRRADSLSNPDDSGTDKREDVMDVDDIRNLHSQQSLESPHARG